MCCEENLSANVFEVEGSDFKVGKGHGTGGSDLHLLVLGFKHLSNVV